MGKGQAVYEGLGRKGIFVRYFSSPWLKDFARISVGLPHETDALLEALGGVLKELS